MIPGEPISHVKITLPQRLLMAVLFLALLLSAALLLTTVWFAWSRFTSTPPQEQDLAVAVSVGTEFPAGKEDQSNATEPVEAAASGDAAASVDGAASGDAAASTNAEASADAGGVEAQQGMVLTPTPFLPAQEVKTPPTASLIAEPSPAPHVWLPGERYTVGENETLQDAARSMGVTEEQARAANSMYGNAVLAGQTLIVPAAGELSPAPWRYASIDKEQSDVFYPMWVDAQRFRLHYMPDTLPAVDPQAVVGMMERGIAHVEGFFGLPLAGSFDVYAAGTLYEPPNRYLRGRSFSLDRKVFFLHDGSGDAINQQYLAAHEITHMYAWNTWGQPFSFLLSEGAAVYTGMQMIDGSIYLPIRAFCAIYKQQGRLPVLFDKNEIAFWRGHNNNLMNYYSGGCLIGYLIETYGVEKFGQVYHTQDYELVYGKELERLEQDWKASISIEDIPAGFDSARYVPAVERFMAANDVYFDAFSPTPQMFQTYRALDGARMAILSADLNRFDQQMLEFDRLFGR